MIRALRWLKRSSSKRRRTRIRFGLRHRFREIHEYIHSYEFRIPPGNRGRTAALTLISAVGLGLTGCEWLPTRQPGPAADRSAFAGPFYLTDDSGTAAVAAAPWLLSNPRNPSSFPPFYPSIIDYRDPALPEDIAVAQGPSPIASGHPHPSQGRRPPRPRVAETSHSSSALAQAETTSETFAPSPTAPRNRERAAQTQGGVDSKIVRASITVDPPPTPKTSPTVPPATAAPASSPSPTLAPALPPPLTGDWRGSPRPSERPLFGAPELDASALGTLAAPASWADQWRRGVESLAALAAEPSAGLGSSEWGVQKALMDWLRDRSMAANSPKTTKSTAPNDENGLEQLIDSIENARDLKIIELRLCREIRGYGDLQPFEETTFAPGQQLLIYCEMGGLRSRTINGEHHWRLETTLEVLSETDGSTALREQTRSEDQCAKTRQDFFASYLFQIPSHLPPGKHKLRVTQRDVIGKQTDVAEIPLQVKK